MRMTTGRRLLLGLALLSCLGLAGIVPLVFVQPRLPITPDNFAKIKIGMREKEVVEIFGGPGIGAKGQQHWDGQEWVATIYFDEEGLVSATMFGPNQDTFLRKLRRWFGL